MNKIIRYLTLFSLLGIISLISPLYVNASVLYEYYNTGWDTGVSLIPNTYWCGQTFTASSNHTLSSLSIMMCRSGSPGIATVSIRLTSSGLPTGGDLCSGTTNGNTLPPDPGEFRNINMSPVINLQSGVQYAYVVRSAVGTGWDCLSQKLDISSPTYGGGIVVSSADSGVTWGGIPTWDGMFEIYGTALASPTIITLLASDITRTTAILNGSVNSTGEESSNVTFHWGKVDCSDNSTAWSFNGTPTSPTQPQGVAACTKSVSALIPDTLYYFNTSVNNSAGTSWGTTQSFYTLTLMAPSGGWDMIPTPPPTPDLLYAEGGYSFPFGSMIRTLAIDTGQDPTTFLFGFAFFLAIAGAIGTFILTHKVNMGQRGSLFLASIVAGVILIYFYRTATVPGLVIVPFGIIALLLIVWRKSPAPLE